MLCIEPLNICGVIGVLIVVQYFSYSTKNAFAWNVKIMKMHSVDWKKPLAPATE